MSVRLEPCELWGCCPRAMARWPVSSAVSAATVPSSVARTLTSCLRRRSTASRAILPLATSAPLPVIAASVPTPALGVRVADATASCSPDVKVGPASCARRLLTVPLCDRRDDEDDTMPKPRPSRPRPDPSPAPAVLDPALPAAAAAPRLPPERAPPLPCRPMFPSAGRQPNTDATRCDAVTSSPGPPDRASRSSEAGAAANSAESSLAPAARFWTDISSSGSVASWGMKDSRAARTASRPAAHRRASAACALAPAAADDDESEERAVTALRVAPGATRAGGTADTAVAAAVGAGADAASSTSDPAAACSRPMYQSAGSLLLS